jgi:hypothetical protein
MSTYRFFTSWIGSLFGMSNIYDGYNTMGAVGGLAPPVRFTSSFPSTSYPGFLYNQQTIEQYLAVLDMLSEISMFSIAGLATKFISEAVIESMAASYSITVNIEDQNLQAKVYDEVMDYLEKIDIVKIVKSVLDEVIYYGSYSFWVDHNLSLNFIYDPYSAISVIGKDYKEIGYLINTQNGMMFIEKHKASLFRIGMPDMILYTRLNNLDDSIENTIMENKATGRARNFIMSYSNIMKDALDDNTFIRKYVFSAPTPLFYYARMKLREYVVKEVVLALVTLRDLLFPTVYTLGYEYPSYSFTVQNLADQIENILNSYVDVSGFVGVKGALYQVLNMITYSIRVLPDFKGSIANLNPIDTNKITEKLDKYKGEMNDLLEQVLNEVGIPTEGFTGKTTYWESLRQSERFATKINHVCASIEHSISDFCEYIAKVKMRGALDGYNDFIKFKMFDLTIGKLSKMQNAVSTIQSYLSESSELLVQAIEKLETEGINKEAYANFVKSLLLYIYPNIEEIVNWSQILKGEENEEEIEEEEDIE